MEKKLETQIEHEITELIENVLHFFDNKDVEGLLSLYNANADPDPMVIGTAEDEIVSGIQDIKEFQERGFSEIDNEMTLDYTIHSISTRGSIA